MLLSFLFGDVGEGRAAVWDGAPGAGVLLIDRSGRIRRLSDGAPQLLGLSRAELLGAPLANAFAPEAGERLNRALALGAAAGRVRARLASGPARELLFSLRPDGRASALILPVEADAAAEPPSGTAAEAPGSPQAGAALLADLSHEMRTPLNAVIGFADAMAAETYGPLGHPKYEEYAGIIRASGRHLLDLVSSILDLARIEAGRYGLRRETTDVGALARECAAMLRNEAEKAGLRLRLAIADDLPEAALDPRAIRQVIINLLSNAIKFTPDGEVALEVARDGEEIAIVVSDTGVGMSAADLARLGRRFAASAADGVRGAKGAGLGLSLAIALVELHGGRLDIASAPGEGVRAEARVPILAPARPERRLRAIVNATQIGVAEAGAIEAPQAGGPSAILTQLERIEAFRRERARNAA